MVRRRPQERALLTYSPTTVCRVCVPHRPFGFYSLAAPDRCSNEGHVSRHRAACKACRRVEACDPQGYCINCGGLGRFPAERLPVPVTYVRVETNETRDLEYGYPPRSVVA